MVKGLKVGDKIPRFHVKDHAGYSVREEDVIGTPLVIYFYPKDQTPTCTKEACSFQNSLPKFDQLQVLVLGVSPDSVGSHKKFIEKNNLQFSLLSDAKKDMCKKFGVLKGDKVIRSTFVVNARGVIQWIEKPVKVEGHVKRVLEAIKEHCSEDLVRYKGFEEDYADFLKGRLELTEDEEVLRKKIMKKYGIQERDLKGK